MRRGLFTKALGYLLLYISVVFIYSFIFISLMEQYEGKSYDLPTAIYWVITIMSTTGLGDIYFTTHIGHAFTTVVEITGVILIFALMFPLIITPWLENRIKLMPIGNPPKRIKDHVVICGYNALVESLIAELQKMQRQFVLIDSSESVIKTLAMKNMFCVYGDASEENTLKQAFIEDARVLIANKRDEENAHIVLTASKIAKAEIVALVEDMKLARYLEYAGANRVISPKQILGINLGKKAAMPWTQELLDAVDVLGDLKIAEFPVYQNPEIVNKTLRDSKIREETGVTIIAIWQDGELILNPHPETILKGNSMIVALGRSDQLRFCSKFTGCRPVSRGKHIIVAGHGDVGKQVARILRNAAIPYIVVDKKPQLDQKHVIGDSASEEVLQRADILNASMLVVTLNNDSENIYTTLIARKLNPEIQIIARANLESSVDKLYRAGADYVLSLSMIGAKMLIKLIEEKKLIDETAIMMERIGVFKSRAAETSLVGKKIEDSMIRASTGCTVIGIEKGDRFISNPEPQTLITGDSTLILIGTEEQIQKYEKKFKLPA